MAVAIDKSETELIVIQTELNKLVETVHSISGLICDEESVIRDCNKNLIEAKQKRDRSLEEGENADFSEAMQQIKRSRSKIAAAKEKIEQLRKKKFELFDRQKTIMKKIHALREPLRLREQQLENQKMMVNGLHDNCQVIVGEINRLFDQANE